MAKKFSLFTVAVIAGLVFTSVAVSEIDKKKKSELYRNVELFADALTIVQSEYVDEVEAKDLIYGSLKGLMSSLDAHSQFMDPEIYKELKVETEGKFGGLGIEITIKEGLLTVVTPIEGTPAWEAGIKANDRIVKIDDEITRDMTLMDAVKRLRGKAGDPVTVTILRESENKILTLKIVRDIIQIKDIKDASILEDGIAYIRLVEFRENTPQELDSALKDLTKQGMSALILDLRNNPGGLLDVSVKVSEKFIEKGKLVVYTKGRKSSQNFEFHSRYAEPYLDMPIVVLINEGSASGSEIVAACLQDYNRAIIVGAKSFGKGSVQTVIPLSDGSALRLTTSKYYTPSGRQIHNKGIEPDISVESGEIQLGKKKEAKPEKADEVFEKVEKQEEEAAETKMLDYQSDNQLMHAVDIVKVLKLSQKTK